MLNTVRKILPAPVKKPIRQLIKTVKYTRRKYAIRTPIANDQTIKIIVGAAETFQDGWYSTNEQWLDITKQQDWENTFKGKAILSHVVAEHVFEHLTEGEALTALKHIYNHMIPGGRIRIAVPDGNNPDPIYLKHVGINGIGDDAADHKQLLTVETLKKLIKTAGFKPQHIEGYTKTGKLIQKQYATTDGFIYRSRANNSAEGEARWDFPDANTSLIVDGIKAG